MDTPWAYTHRAHLRLFLTITIVSVLTVYFAIKLYEPPSCVDNKLNQDETGVDCGGTCDRYCPREVQATRSAWVRAFEVSEGWWSAVAYVENPNFDKQARYAPYRFAVYDKSGVLLLERKGVTFAHREPLLPVFEGRLKIDMGVPFRTTFEWLQELDWYKAPRAYEVTTEEQNLKKVGLGHDLEVTIYNRSPEPLRNIEVVAILYDTDENAVAASETLIDLLSARSKKKITFSWPRPFTGEIGRIEIVPRVPEQTL